MPVVVRWKEEEDRVPCDRERYPVARGADVLGVVLIPAAGHVGGEGAVAPGKSR